MVSVVSDGRPPDTMGERGAAQKCPERRLSPDRTVGNPRLGVVVLNWRRPREILDCLASIEAQTYRSHETVVVDNGSVNHSLAEIRRRFPAVSVVENDRNLGFAGGSNVGIDFLLRRAVDYILLLNDDATCEPDLLRKLIDRAESDSSIGVLGPTIFYANEPRTIVWSAGGVIDRLGRARQISAPDPRDEDFRGVRDVDYVTGCALLIRRCVIEQIGTLDERFFAYWEEAEWCARARAAGFRVVHAAGARVWHGFLHEDRETSHAYQYLMTRNRLLYLECATGSRAAVTLAVLDILRTVLSWRLKPRHRTMRPFVGDLLQALRDYALRRFGPPPLSA